MTRAKGHGKAGRRVAGVLATGDNGGERRRGAMPRWYVLQVERGRERTMSALLTKVLGPEVLAEPVFQPRFECELKVRGEYVRCTKPLVEGYLVVVSHDAERLEKALYQMVEFTRLLGTAAGPAPLTREEVALFGGMGEAGERALPMSRGYKLASGRIAVTEGPLAGREALIERVDRHKSLARLVVTVGGERITARAGLALLPAPEGDTAFERRLERMLDRRTAAGMARSESALEPERVVA